MGEDGKGCEGRRETEGDLNRVTPLRPRIWQSYSHRPDFVWGDTLNLSPRATRIRRGRHSVKSRDTSRSTPGFDHIFRIGDTECCHRTPGRCPILCPSTESHLRLLSASDASAIYRRRAVTRARSFICHVGGRRRHPEIRTETSHSADTASSSAGTSWRSQSCPRRKYRC